MDHYHISLFLSSLQNYDLLQGQQNFESYGPYFTTLAHSLLVIRVFQIQGSFIKHREPSLLSYFTHKWSKREIVSCLSQED